VSRVFDIAFGVDYPCARTSQSSISARQAQQRPLTPLIPLPRTPRPLETETSNESNAVPNTFAADPIVQLPESIRFSRIRAGRYFFYLNAPSHFSVDRQFVAERAWTKKLVTTTFDLLRKLHRDDQLSNELCIEKLGIELTDLEKEALNSIAALAESQASNIVMQNEYSRAITLFPRYYRLVERTFQKLWEKEPLVITEPQPSILKIDGW